MDKYTFLDKHFINEEFIIEAEFAISIGINTILDNCIIINKLPARGISFNNCTMNGGAFITKKQLTNWQQHNVIFDGVKFKGSFKGCEFGGLIEDLNHEYKMYGYLANCDFSEAKIHQSRLFHADIDSVIFPKFPHYTILHPHQQKDNIAQIDCHPHLKTIKKLIVKAPSEETARIYNAEMIAKKEKIDVNEVRKFFEQIENVIY